ncbi:MAG: hypothetical protein PHX20_02015 [Candidatus Omnitrophica bacterium]|nr:hypothetical protein [Candidatus Omnitrophota bacterium]
MIIIFEPDPPFIRWRTVKNGRSSRDRIIFGGSCFDKVRQKIAKENNGERILFGYLLPNGGEEIDKPVSILTGRSLARMEKCVRFLPEHNSIIYKMAKYLSMEFADHRHVLFCDTSFFICLPDKASTYAIPYELSKKGVRRYGGYGLCHERAWEEARRVFGRGVQKVISVYLGNAANIAAIKNGAPVETTVGFTSVEGIPSQTACGDIDPTIIFQLNAEGMSFERINDLLSRGSGLNCLPDQAPEILKYHIARYTGAFISVLGGIDAIVFTADNAKNTKTLILRICHLLDFLGFKSRIKIRKTDGRTILSKGNSKIKGLYLQYDKWKMLSEKAIALAHDKET